jgi:nitric-oxide synthase
MASCPFHSSGETLPAPSSPSTFPSASAGDVAPDLEAELAFLREAHRGSLPDNRRIEITAALGEGRPAPLTAPELTWAGRIAWRNHARCIGRLHWRSLVVRDCRSLSSADDLAESLREHLRLVQEGDTVKSILTVFAPPERRGGAGPRIWNSQLCSYAGYRQPDGSTLGDPANERLTAFARRLGWQPPRQPGAFDLLPWIISGPDGQPHLVPLPDAAVREVRLRHPRLAWFESLGLKWYAVPIISGMRFRAAGTDFSAAPFNGWYMGTEIGARNLADSHRYNQLPRIAERLGLDTSDPRSLWKDRALLELNEAVLHSYAADGVKLVDHHTASDEFIHFLAREKNLGREVSARWDWIVPPLSGATTAVFHTPLREFPCTPDFHAQLSPFETPMPANCPR